MEITLNSAVAHSSNTLSNRVESNKSQHLPQTAANPQPELQLSSTSQALTQAFQQAVNWLQQESLTSQLLALNQTEQQDIWIQWRNMFV